MKIIIPNPPLALMRAVPIGRGRAIDPKIQVQAKKAVRWIMREQYSEEPLNGCIFAVITFYIPIPNSFSEKKRRAIDGCYCNKKPDIDNLEKFLLDCANGILIEDDRMVVMVEKDKIYSKEPRTEMELWSECDDYPGVEKFERMVIRG